MRHSYAEEPAWASSSLAAFCVPCLLPRISPFGMITLDIPYPVDWLLICLLAVAGAIVTWRWRRAVQHDVPVQEPAEEPAQEEEPEERSPVGPGPILAKLAGLHEGLLAATEDLRVYTTRREVQMQQWQRTCQEVVRRMLPVLENLEPYLDDADEQVADVARVAHGRLLTELATVGVTQIRPAPGDPFDEHFHQLDHRTTGIPPYEVVEVVSPGFLFTPRIAGAANLVLKPAEVIGKSMEQYEEATPGFLTDAGEDITEQTPSSTSQESKEQVQLEAVDAAASTPSANNAAEEPDADPAITGGHANPGEILVFPLGDEDEEPPAGRKVYTLDDSDDASDQDYMQSLTRTTDDDKL